MKKLLPLLLLAACGSSHHSKPAAPQLTASLDDLSDTLSLCPSDLYLECYPEGSPIRRNDLYECKNGGTAHAWIEFMNDGSRLYHAWLKLPENITESFVAEESAEAAKPFNPIAYGLGTPQSSRVLHGMAADTKKKLGLPENTNFLFTLIGSQTSAVSMTVAADNGASFGIPDLNCQRVGN